MPTAFADVAVWDSDGKGSAVLLLHGNSSRKTIFRHQFESPLGRGLRLIAMDLPGHGASSDAKDPAAGYTLGGYATAAVEVLRALGVTRATVFGWSLGGHVALDMISRFPGITGVMISGTPPIPGGLEGVALGFRQSEHMALAGAGDWSEADAEAYAHATAGAGAPFEPFMLEAARRTPGVARETFFANALGGGVDDQRRIVETAKVPLAIVNGAEDAFINAAYFDTVAYANLWDGKVHSLAGLGHAPFWQDADQFDRLLERFVAETAQ
ncbi:MAG: alpha/beta fold hydrolase [Caulobacterales bacterium]